MKKDTLEITLPKLMVGLALDGKQAKVSDFFERHYLLREIFEIVVLILCLVNVFNTFYSRPTNVGLVYLFDIGTILYVIFIRYNSNFAARDITHPNFKWGYDIKDIKQHCYDATSRVELTKQIEEIQSKRKKKNNIGKLTALLLIAYYLMFMIVNLRLKTLNGYMLLISSVMIASGLFILWLRNLFGDLKLVFATFEDEEDGEKEKNI